MAATAVKLAVLIDADNLSSKLADALFEEVAKEGEAIIRRAYGNWTSPQLQPWKEALHQFAITPVQQFSYVPGKNATDGAMIIDAMDILYRNSVDGFCIVSSDSDYTRLATRLRESGKYVVGIGEGKTPAPLIKACNRFVMLENIVAPRLPTSPPNDSPSKPQSSKAPKSRPKSSGVPSSKPEAGNSVPRELLRKAFEASQDDQGRALMAAMGIKLRVLDPAFDVRTYGHRQLLPLVEASGLFLVEKDGVVVSLRLRES